MAGHARNHGVPDSEVAEDGINIGKIVVIGVLSLVVFAAGIVWAYYLMVARQNDVRRLGPARVAGEIGKLEIGIVDQVPFDIDTRLDEWREMSRQKLAGHGWVDRARGIARIPIEAAMERVVANPPDIAGTGPVPMAAPPTLPPTTPAAGTKGAGGRP